MACYHKGNQDKEYSGLWFGNQCLFTMKGDLMSFTSIYLRREVAQDRSRASETRKENIDYSKWPLNLKQTTSIYHLKLISNIYCLANYAKILNNLGTNQLTNSWLSCPFDTPREYNSELKILLFCQHQTTAAFFMWKDGQLNKYVSKLRLNQFYYREDKCNDKGMISMHI